jgi:phosphatidylinositol glycan class B
MPWLLVICIFAFLVRVFLALRFPNIVHPDEAIQYIEQANRIVIGRGLIPWEYSAGIRSWLIPGMLVPLIAITRMMFISPDSINLVIILFSSILSIVVIISAYELTVPVNGPQKSLIAALFIAFWPEIVYFSPHVIADTFSAVSLIAALAFGYRHAASRRAIAATGALLALTVLLRPQLGPAAIVAAIWIGGLKDWQKPLSLIGSGIAVLAIFGLFEWLTLGAPFQSIYRYVFANSAGIASTFGTSSHFYYLGIEAMIWWGAIVPILITAYIGARRLPLLAVVAGVILITFSAVGHKEYRFIYPALPLIMTLCGVGTGEIIRLWEIQRPDQPRWMAYAAMILCWGFAAIHVVVREPMLNRLHYGRGSLLAIRAINSDTSICSVAVDPSERWWLTGLFRFRQDLNLYELGNQPLAGPQAYNAILSFPSALRIAEYRSAGFVSVGCFEDEERTCLFRRTTICHAKNGIPLRAPPKNDVRQILERIGLGSHKL